MMDPQSVCILVPSGRTTGEQTAGALWHRRWAAPGEHPTPPETGPRPEGTAAPSGVSLPDFLPCYLFANAIRRRYKTLPRGRGNGVDREGAARQGYQEERRG